MPGVESIWILKYLDIENLLRGEGGHYLCLDFTSMLRESAVRPARQNTFQCIVKNLEVTSELNPVMGVVTLFVTC